jgi:hypothetical protein
MAVNTAGQTLAQSNHLDPRNSANGSITFDATAITAADQVRVTLGFEPKYVVVDNVTDRIKVEWYEGMADDTCVKTAAAGTRTLETTNKGITPEEKGFLISQNATLAVIAASKVIRWYAVG